MTPAVVDTSVWIEFLRGNDTPEGAVLRKMIEEDAPVHITPSILQELLMGVSKDDQFAELKETLFAFPLLVYPHIAAALGAAELYRSARKNGVTVRKSVDCLIAWYAIEAELPVLHRDRDFDLLAEVSGLSVISV